MKPRAMSLVASKNPYLKANDWGWQIDPEGSALCPQQCLRSLQYSYHDCGERTGRLLIRLKKMVALMHPYRIKF